MAGKRGELCGLGCTLKACEAEQLEPVRMALPGQSLSRCFSHPLWPLAALEGMVIKEEAQQVQVTRPELTVQKEIPAQSAIEVFDPRARTMEVVGEIDDRGLHPMGWALEFSMKLRCLRPIRLGCGRKALQRQQRSHGGQRDAQYLMARRRSKTPARKGPSRVEE